MEIYKTNGVCAKEIGVEIEDGILKKSGQENWESLTT